MAAHEMFLAMILKNAQRLEARGVILSVEGDTPRIGMLLGDGSAQPVTPPPADAVLRMIEILEGGQTLFRSSVFAVTIDTVQVRRSTTESQAHITAWTIEHNED